MLPEGIYIEFNNADTSDPLQGGRDDFLHTYIVYRDGKGGARVIRGGPSGLDEKRIPILGFKEPNSDFLKFGPLGKIEVQADVPLDKSKDAYKPGETPEDRHATPIDIGNRDPEKVFDQMARKAEEVDDLNIDYDINVVKGLDSPDQNSNSLPRFLMEDAGIDAKTAIPEKIDRARIPGFENNLKEALDEARREREEARRERDRPNPIEGEIGGTDDQNPTPAPQSGDNGPTGQDDDASDDSSPSGDAQKQSARVDDPLEARTLLHKFGDEGGKQTLELKLGPDGKPISKELTPEQQNLLDDFKKADGPLDDILSKDPRDLTEAEFVELKKQVIRLPSGPEQEQLDAMAVNFLEDKFGAGKAKFDAVGRMIEPKVIRPINKTPVPAKTPDGEPLTDAVSKIGKVVAETAGDEGSANAVQGLQRGLNLLKQIVLRGRAKSFPAERPGHGTGLGSVLVPDLKTDGVVGSKTRQALRIATSKLGRPRIEEGLTLGRFGRFAENVQSGRDDTRKLGPTITKSFGPLFRPAVKVVRKEGITGRLPLVGPSTGREENLAFQSTINDLGFQSFGKEKFNPILEDGFIGPKTESTFNTILPAAGTDRFTSRLGHNLGFFDFDGIA